MKIPHGMDQEHSERPAPRERRALPFFIEFVKFATGFAVIIAIALVALRVSAAMS